MKKIFTLVVALFVMTFCTKAQVVFSDDFENYAAFTVDPTGSWTYYDVDGASTYALSGATWTNQYYVGSGIVMNPSQVSPSQSANWAPHSGNQFFAVWDAVPSEIVSGTTTNDWIVTPELTLTDAAIVSFYAREVVGNYGPEEVRVLYSTTTNAMDAFVLLQTLSVSEVEWTEHTFNIPADAKYVAINVVSDDIFGFFMDDFSIFYQPTEPTIQVSETMNFATIMANSTATMQTNVVAYNLTSAITATTAAPFAVSADGNTWSTTASLAAAGGTLYVQYAPTAAGPVTGTITLASAGATDVTITVNANAIDCDNITLPYFCDFSNEALANCWTVVDVAADGDAEGYGKFNIDPAVADYFLGEPAAMYIVSATDTVNNANDWLISPAFPATETTLASFDYLTYLYWGMLSIPEKFSVYVIPEGETYATATQVVPTQEVEPYDWTTQTVDLSAFAGQTIQVAIKAESDPNGGYLAITNFNVFNAEETLELSDYELDFGVIPAGNNVDKAVVVSTMAVTEDIVVSTTAPFAVSVDGINFGTTATIPAPTGMLSNDTIYVQYAPLAAGSDNAIVSVSTSTLADTIEVSGVAVECNVIDQFPFTESFEGTSETLPCWTVNDANNDGKTFVLGDGTATYSYSAANAADDWLISPELALTGAQYLSFNYSVAGATFPETFQVFIKQGSTESALTEVMTVSNTTAEELVVDLSEYTGNYQVAIHCTSNADMYKLYISEFAIREASETLLEVNPTSMSFSAMAGSVSSAQVASVSAMALTEDITVVAPAQFEVSSDGNTFASICTITNAGLVTMGNLYVRYNPTAAGSHSGIVTLTSGTTTADIAVSGNAIDCSNPVALPFVEDFEAELTDCWSNIDNDGDGYTWSMESVGEAHTGAGCYSSSSFLGQILTPDNWLITPQLAIPAQGAYVGWWVAAQDPSYPDDHYEVMVSPTLDLADFVSVYEETISTDAWTERNVDLAQFAGQNVYIAFVHNECTDVFRMKIDDITVAAGTGIQEVANNSTVVYPNPANNVINVNSTSNINGVEIYTIAGQKVANYTANGTQTAISVSNLSNGMYLMKINTENGTSVQKFNVVR